MIAAERRSLIRVEGLTKSFGSTRALDDFTLDLHAGEIVAVVGHNGSGKSTLVKLLAGFHTSDAGTINLHQDADQGTEMRFIHQDLGLVGTLSTVENLSLTPSAGGAPWRRVRRVEERRQARELIRQFGLDIDVDVLVQELSPAERTIVAIARALKGWVEERDIVLVLDEPTAALHGSEVDRLMTVVRRVAERGAGVLFISHRLDEVLGVADTVVALRNGRMVGNLQRSAVDYGQLVQLVAGEIVEELERHAGEHGAQVLQIEALAGGALRHLNVTVHAGEIVGVAGILGSGRDEVCAMIFGGTRRTNGTIRIGFDEVAAADLRQSIRSGAGFVPGDRHGHGAVMTMTAAENLGSVRVPGVESRWRRVRKTDELRAASAWFATCGVLPARPEMDLSQFSGGNQQKVVLAKWLRIHPKILLLEEPTQGVDVGAKARIHELIVQTADKGAAVLVASSEAKELAQLCDRVLVLADGLVVDELTGADVTESRILHASVPA
jgi:ribose transport system ATP-binding protein